MIRSITLYFALFFALVALADEGNTPLPDAAKNNDYKLAVSLIAKGADVNAKNSNWQTPMDIARVSKNWKIAKLLE